MKNPALNAIAYCHSRPSLALSFLFVLCTIVFAYYYAWFFQFSNNNQLGNFTQLLSGVRFYKSDVNEDSNVKPTSNQPEFPLICTVGNVTVRTCPASYYPARFPAAQVDHNLDPASQPMCPDYFRWIHEDLMPWRETGITLDMVEMAKKRNPKRAHFRLVIVNGTAYVETLRRSFQTRDKFTQWSILQMLRRYPGKIPDLDLVFNCEDKPAIIKEFYPSKDARAPPPLFGYDRDDASLDIVFPDWSFWGWPEINIKPWETLKRDLKEGNEESQWVEREPYAYWKGTAKLAPSRMDLLRCNASEKQEWNARIYDQDWKSETKSGFKASNLASQCTHRYKIYIEGIGWSVSEKYILACDSVTLLVKPRYYDFFSRGLIPLQHYWPIRVKDKCKAIKHAVDWGNSHPEEAQAMGRAASKFIQEELQMEYIYDYMFHLLTEYAKLLKYKPTVPPNAVELCSEAMFCTARGLMKDFFMDTVVMGPSDTEPCKLPPPFDAGTLLSVLERNENAIEQVEDWENQYWDSQKRGAATAQRERNNSLSFENSQMSQKQITDHSKVRDANGILYRHWRFTISMVFLLNVCLAVFMSIQLLSSNSISGSICSSKSILAGITFSKNPLRPWKKKSYNNANQIDYSLNCPATGANATAITCPASYLPSNFLTQDHNEEDEAAKDQNQPTCPEYFRYIHEDLSPWRESGITLAMVEAALKKIVHFRLTIVNGTAYVETYRKTLFQTREFYTQWGVLQLLRLYPGKIPDLDLIFYAGDRPSVGIHRGAPPLFGYDGDYYTMDIAFPDWSFWGWPEIRIRGWEYLSKELKEGNERRRWVDRERRAYWKGNEKMSESRRELLKCNVTEKQDWNAMIYTQDWKSESREGFKNSRLSDQCKHRYKIYIEGIGWSVSQKYILACDAVTLLVTPRYYDFFTRSLMPLQHYWPIRVEDKCRSIKYAVDWGNSHPQEAQAIGKAASDFIQENLQMKYIYDYMFHLLTSYAKLLRYKPSIPPNAVKICPESLACPADEMVRQYMKDSAVKSPSDVPPCTMPPPYDPPTLRSIMAKKENTLKQVEEWEKLYWDAHKSYRSVESPASHRKEGEEMKIGEWVESFGEAVSGFTDKIRFPTWVAMNWSLGRCSSMALLLLFFITLSVAAFFSTRLPDSSGSFNSSILGNNSLKSLFAGFISPNYPPKSQQFPLNCWAANLTKSCPSSYYPSNYTTRKRPNQSPLQQPKCPEYFRWIHEDFWPWRETGITAEMVEVAKALESAKFRLVVVNGTAYLKTYRRAFQTRDVFTQWGILQLLRLYPGQIPDLDLVFGGGDRPTVPRDTYPDPNVKAPPPLFSYDGDASTADIVFPDWSFWGWPEINIKPWETLLKELKEGNEQSNWTDREPYAYWKGNPNVSPNRMDLVKCNVSDTQDWKARIYAQAQGIGKGASKFIQEELRMSDVYDYMFHLLTEYSKLLTYKPVVPSGAVELCSESMVCAAEIKERPEKSIAMRIHERVENTVNAVSEAYRNFSDRIWFPAWSGGSKNGGNLGRYSSLALLFLILLSVGVFFSARFMDSSITITDSIAGNNSLKSLFSGPKSLKYPPVELDKSKAQFPLNCWAGNVTKQCPSTYYPAHYTARNQNESPEKQPQCPEYFRWIHEELWPWRETGVTGDMVTAAAALGSADFRLVIVNGTAYLQTFKRSFQTRDIFTQWGILQLLRLYPGEIPDLDLVFNCGDHPSVPKETYRKPNAQSPPPQFSYDADDTTTDIVFPDWSFWGWPEVNIKPWERLSKEIKEGNKETEWKKREPQAFWKGNPYVSPNRVDLLKCNVSGKQDWNARIYTQDWVREIQQGFKSSNLATQCKHRYKIYIEGRAWSVSEKYILACDSPTLLVNPRYYHFLSRNLMPLEHYWPIRSDDNKCRSIKFAVEWGNKHQREAQGIGRAASKFIQEELQMKYIYDYMFHLLTAYAKLLTYKPVVPPGAVQLCSESMACAAEVQQQLGSN
ncbi:OLC1v1027413C2 [Oldenlandia corymbosa var. corymbosa]|nr:OLC1v1027413C2 [Oldenlandia corymbosa var. corymbosa]